ncbi:MAG: hypothetical protein AB1758_09040 [Candidatus Eremiobacterota bacterium]
MRTLVLVLSLAWLTAAAPADYFPMEAGWVWTYQWTADQQQFDYTVEVVKAEGQRALLRTLMPRVLTQEWYEKRADSVAVTGLEDPDGASAEYSPPRVYLALPLQPGKTWEWSGKLGQSASIADHNKVVSSASVQVPAGTFSCMVIETITEQSGAKLNQLSYYAPGVGLVKNVTDTGAGRWVSQLKSYRAPNR